MSDWILNIFAENQTSNAGTLVFTLLSIIVFMAVALTFYALIMLVIWKLKFRGAVTLPRLFFPSVRQVKEYFGEYALGAVTSLVLAVTVKVKHTLVEEIMEQRIAGLNLSPDHFMPARFLDAELADKISSWTVGCLLQPLLESGKSDGAELLLTASVKAAEKTGLVALLTDTTLLIISVILATAYLVWMIVHRTRQLKEDPDTQGTLFKRQIRGLLVLAVCIALLLAAPVLVSDSALADSVRERAVQAADRSEGKSQADLDLMETVRVEIKEQKNLFAFLKIFVSADGEEPNDILDAIARINTDLSNLRTDHVARIRDLERSKGALEAQLSDVETTTGSLKTSLQGLRSDIIDVEQRLRSSLNQLEADLSANHRADIQNLANQYISLNNQFNQFNQQYDQFMREYERQVRELGARFGSYASLSSIRDIERVLESMRESMSTQERRLAELQSQLGRSPEPGFLVAETTMGCSYNIQGISDGTNSAQFATWPLKPGTYTINSNCIIDVNLGNYKFASSADSQNSPFSFQPVLVSQQRSITQSQRIIIRSGEVTRIRFRSLQ